MLICADWVIAGADVVPLRNAAVRVVDGVVDAVGPADDLRAAHPADEVVDAIGHVVMPGFVNAHVHLYGVLAHGIQPVALIGGFPSFLEDYWWPQVEDRLDRAMIVAATEWVCAEMLRSGTTTFYDILEAPGALGGVLLEQADAVERMGMRGILSFEATERSGSERARAGLAENLAMIDHGRRPGAAGLVSGAMCFHTTFTCSEAFIREAFGLAGDRDVFCHAHVNEGEYEGEWCERRHGRRTIEWYEHIGVLGDRFLASQCVQLSETERELIAGRGVRVAHMPLANCEVGGGIAPIPELVAAGTVVGLGSDGYINDGYEVMRGVFLLHKARLLDPSTMPAATVFGLATSGAASALGIGDRVGRLEVGFQADLQVVDAHFPTPATADNLFDQIVLRRSGHHVRDVMVAGRWRVRGGAVDGVDVERLRARVHEQAGRLWAPA